MEETSKEATVGEAFGAWGPTKIELDERTFLPWRSLYRPATGPWIVVAAEPPEDATENEALASDP